MIIGAYWKKLVTFNKGSREIIMARTTTKRNVSAATRPQRKNPLRFKPGNSGPKYNRPNAAGPKKTDHMIAATSTNANQTSNSDKSSKFLPMSGHEMNAAKYIMELTRLGYSFDKVQKGSKSNYNFLSKMYNALRLPVNIDSGDISSNEENDVKIAVKENLLTKPTAFQNSIEKQETPKLSQNETEATEFNQSTSAPNVSNTKNRSFALPEERELTAIDSIASEMNEEKLGMALYEQTSRILMKTRLNLLKLKAAANKRVPKFSKELEASLKKKKDLLISDIESFYSTIGLRDEFAPGMNDDFIELGDSFMDKSNHDERIVNDENELPKRLQSPDQHISMANSKTYQLNLNQASNGLVEPSTIIQDSVIKLKKSTPDHFTPYQSLNLTKRTQPNT